MNTNTTTDYWAYIGNYGKTAPRGIYLMRYAAGSGVLSMVGSAAEAAAPNFLAVHPSGRFLYAVTAAKVGDYAGAIEAFAVDPASGKLTFLNRRASGGDDPAHVVLDPTGRLAIVANYGGGTLGVFPLGEDGRIGEATAIVQHEGSSVNKGRQSEPHPHEVIFDGTGRHILSADLGVDWVYRYAVDVKRGTLTPQAPGVVPPGSGPRHVVVGNDQRHAYVINEMTSTISVFDYAAEGAMREIETLKVWEDDRDPGGAEIMLHPNGRFLYASDRGPSSIGVCAIDGATGKLHVVETISTGGKTPRHFGLDPAGRFLLASNMDSNEIVVFAVDGGTGRLSQTSERAAVEAPCCTVFVPIRK